MAGDPLGQADSSSRSRTDEGLTGIADGTGNAGVFRAYLDELIKPLIVGVDPLRPRQIWETLRLGRGELGTRFPSRIVGPIDVACWDILGKAAGLPLYTLLGGARRTEIPLYWSRGNGWAQESGGDAGGGPGGLREGLSRLQGADGLARLPAGQRPGQGLRHLPALPGVAARRRAAELRRQLRLLGTDRDRAGARVRGAGHRPLRGAAAALRPAGVAPGRGRARLRRLLGGGRDLVLALPRPDPDREPGTSSSPT